MEQEEWIIPNNSKLTLVAFLLGLAVTTFGIGILFAVDYTANINVGLWYNSIGFYATSGFCAAAAIFFFPLSSR